MRDASCILTPDSELLSLNKYYISVGKKGSEVEVLVDFMRKVGGGRSIVYCNGRRTVDKLAGS